MIRAEDLRRQAANKYPDVIQQLLRGEAPFPLPLRYPRIRTTDSREAILRDIKTLQAESRETRGHGLTIEWRDIDTQRYGRNRLPGDICFATKDDFLSYIEKTAETRRILEAAALLTTAFPNLASGLPRHWRLLRDRDPLFWQHVCRVIRYFRDHPFPDRYARQLPIKVPTKFIQQNRLLLEKFLFLVTPKSLLEDGETFEERLGLKTPEGLVDCRILDDSVRPEWIFRQFTIPLSDLRHLEELPVRNVLITENRINFLTLPSLPSTLAIQGQGFAVTRLKRVPFLTQRRIFYWGDLDAQGFEILAVLRRSFPQVESVLMDPTIWNDPDLHRQPGVHTRNQPHQFLPFLHPEEAVLFENLRTMNLRIEQEQIPQLQADAALRTRICS